MGSDTRWVHSKTGGRCTVKMHLLITPAGGLTGQAKVCSKEREVRTKGRFLLSYLIRLRESGLPGKREKEY